MKTTRKRIEIEIEYVDDNEEAFELALLHVVDLITEGYNHGQNEWEDFWDKGSYSFEVDTLEDGCKDCNYMRDEIVLDALTIDKLKKQISKGGE